MCAELPAAPLFSFSYFKQIYRLGTSVKMAKIRLVLSGFVVGLLVAAAVSVWVWTEFHSTTSEVWTTSTEVKLENGATIPAGSELTVHRYMPEGFATLRLSVNVEGESTSKFETRLEDVSFLVIPYSVVQ